MFIEVSILIIASVPGKIGIILFISDFFGRVSDKRTPIWRLFIEIEIWNSREIIIEKEVVLRAHMPSLKI